MKLYGYWRSSTSYRLRCALELKGLEYEQEPVSLIESRHKEETFVSRNPFAGVPMLEADDRDRAQSMAIIEWLDERYTENPLLPSDLEQRFTARELSYAIATELHAPLNLKVLKYLKDPLGHEQGEIETWYRNWLSATLVPVEKRLKQLGTGDFLFDRPGLFEAVLVPQLYNARRFDFELDACDRMCQIEQACLALPAFQRAHPDNQPDAPDNLS